MLVGLALGMGLVFGALFFSAGSDERLKARVLTKANVWLVLSGVIHVSERAQFRSFSPRVFFVGGGGRGAVLSDFAVVGCGWMEGWMDGFSSSR